MPKCPKDCHKPNPLIFRRVIIPSALGDDKENPPENGAYCNALVIYEANNAMYLYSSDGIPTKIPTSITSYNDLTHKPSINGVELEGDISLEELGISDLIEESVASEATARAEADEALQDAIDAEEAARIAADRDIINSIPTVNNATLTIQRNGTSVGAFTANSASDTTINIDVPIYTSGLINDSGYVTEAELSGYATDQDIEDAVSAEASIRADADRDLQSQIDAISSASDVVDVVGTYAELQNYDTSGLSNNDIIKVLTDSAHDNAISYYRWDDANNTFVYIGSQGLSYTKSETDATFVPQTRTVNGKALSTDIVLTASDVSALPASTVIPTVNNATLTIKRNGNNIASFTANSASDVSADITVPTKTSDLTNDSDFVSDASYIHTDNNFTTAEKNKLAGIAAGAEVNVQSDWDQTNSSADDFIKNKPTIPTKTSDLTNDSGFISSLPIASAGTLGAIKVGTNLSIAADGTLSADAQSITVDSALSSTSTNPVENRVINTALGAKADTADLAEVATSGDYDDLLNKPTIPTVNNATLTIQRNGTTVDTFTANASQDKSVNIVVPTATSDLTNDSGFLTSIPTASASTLGGIKVGAGLSITDGVLSTTGGGVADAVEWTNVLNRPTNVSYWTNDTGYITSAALPTATSDLTNDGSDGMSTYVEADELATVATSGDYNDLINKPATPTVNDATITIQRNSATVDSFTVNASQNKSINIVIPTKTSDLTNDSNFITSADLPTIDSTLSTSSTNAVENQAIANAIDLKYDKTGGEITGNAKVDGTFTLDIEDDDYDAGINFTRTLDNNLGTTLTLTGYAGGTNYKPIVRNVGTPNSDYDVANKKYVDDHILTPVSYLVALDQSGAIDLVASSLDYATVKSYLTNNSKDVYLDVIWEPSRFYAKAVQDEDTNNGPINFFANIMRNGTEATLIFSLASNNTLTVWHNVHETLYDKAQAIDSTNVASTTKYPTTKAVADYVASELTPTVIYSDATGLSPLQADVSASIAYQLTGLDLSPYKRIKVHIGSSGSSGTGFKSAGVIEMSLDANLANASTGQWVGSVITENAADRNRLSAFLVAVSPDKTSFAYARATSLYGTAGTNISDAYVQLIEGFKY